MIARFWKILPHVWSILTAVIAVIALLWTVARPFAENFIEQTVDERIGALEEAFDNLEEQNRQGSVQIMLQSQQIELNNRLLEDQRDDIKTILRALRPQPE